MTRKLDVYVTKKFKREEEKDTGTVRSIYRRPAPDARPDWLADG